MELDQKRIEDAIVQEVADKIISDDDLWNRVKSAVDKRIDDNFKKTADAQIQAPKFCPYMYLTDGDKNANEIK